MFLSPFSLPKPAHVDFGVKKLGMAEAHPGKWPGENMGRQMRAWENTGPPTYSLYPII
jgi:hypothetical protein